jgi:hypothetical protein
MEAVVSAIKEHTSNEDLCEHASHALAIFAGSKSNLDKLGEIGACGAVSQALAAHPDNTAVCRRVCEAISSLAEDMLPEEGLQACDAVVNSLRSEPDCEEVCRWTCTAIAHLAPCSAGNEKRLLSLGAETLLKAIVSSSSMSEAVKSKAKKALKSLRISL